MFYVLTALLLSFLISIYFIPVVIRIANTKGLYDQPDERKIHTRPISSLGGVGIFAGFILSLFLSFTVKGSAELQYFAAASMVIFFLGLKDDIMVIKPLRKLVGQLIAAAIVIHLGGVQLTDMHGFMGLHDIPHQLGIFLSYFLVVLVINAINLIDGIDGLAGLIGLVVALVLGSYFLLCKQYFLAVLAFSLVGSLASFLIFNMQPARIFMGDCGSMLIGLVLSILVIRFINYAPYSQDFPVTNSPAVGFSFLVIPLMDTLRVFFIRMMKGHSPFRADRNHIHHLMLKLKWSHSNIAITLAGANLFFIALAFLNYRTEVTLLFFVIAGLFFFGVELINKAGQEKSKVLAPQGSVTAANTQPNGSLFANEVRILTEEKV